MTILSYSSFNEASSQSFEEYRNTYYKINRYVPNTDEMQRLFFNILEQKTSDNLKIQQLVTFFEENADLEKMQQYMPKNGTLVGLATYIVGAKFFK